MKNQKFIFWLLVLMSASVSCEKNDLPLPNGTPVEIYIQLTGIYDVTPEGASFKAKIVNISIQQIVECGFVWNNSNDYPTLDDNFVTYTDIPGTEFSHRVTNNLVPDEKYLVRAYIKTLDTLMYSSTLFFISQGCLPPEIMSFYPDSACGGRTITITGANFSPEIPLNNVAFGGIPGVVLNACADTIWVQSPNTTETKFVKLSVEVMGQNTTSTADFKLICPWSPITDYPGNSMYMNCFFSVNTKGYVCLGMSGLNNYASTALWEFDFNTLSWQEKKEFPAAQRFDAIGFSIGGKGYVGLGYNNDLEGYMDLWEYDPETDSWTQKSDFPGLTDYFIPAYAYVVIDNKLYLFVGKNDEFWSYDPQVDAWTIMPQNTTFQGKWIGQGITAENRGYFISGYGSSFTIWEYKPGENEILKIDAVSSGSERTDSGFIMDNKLYFSAGNYTLLEYDLINKTLFHHDAPTDQDNFNYVFVHDHKTILGKSESSSVFHFYPR